MSTPVVFNGVTYTVPTTGETNWGDQVSSLLLALGQYAAVQTSQIQASRTSTAASTTVQPTDYAVYINYSGAAAVTLPAGASIGQVFALKDLSGAAATNNITISAPFGQTIDGASTYVISGNYGAAALQFIGSNVWTLLAVTPPQALDPTASPSFTGLTLSGSTVSRAAYFDASKALKASTTTSTELGYLSGVTSALQTQLNGKQASGSYVTAPVSIGNGGTGASSTSQSFAFIGPTSGSGAPSFRALVANDIPTLNQNTTGTAANVTASTNATLTTLSALALPQSQVTGLTTSLSGKQATITTGSTAQYLKGDLSLGTLNQAAVAGLTTTDSPTLAGLTITGTATLGPTTPGASYAGQKIMGCNDASNAATGAVGELVESKITAVANINASGSWSAVTSITLAAGDWDICGSVMTRGNSSTFTQAGIAIGTTSASSAGCTYGYDNFDSDGPQATGNTGFHTLYVPRKRVTISTSTTYYLNYFASYSGGTTPQAAGSISARRIR